MLDLLLKLFVKDYQHTEKREVRERYGLFGSFFGLVTNLILFVAKIITGIVLSMPSILADAVNNMSDFGNNFLSIFGFRLSSKGADSEHPFGHQRIEYIISIVIACVIIGLGMVMLFEGFTSFVGFVQSIRNSGAPEKDSIFLKEGGKNLRLFVITIIILSLSVLMKFLQSLMYHVLGKKIDSLQLEALSKDSRNDVLSTILVLVGVIITWFTGYNVDCFFTLLVSILVILSGIGIIKEASCILIGSKPDEELIKNIADFVSSQKGIYGIHDLVMHTYGQAIYASMHVEVDGSKTVYEAHEQIDIIEREILGKFNVNITLHMDPTFVDNPDVMKYKEAVLKGIREVSPDISMHDFRIIPAKTFDNLVFDLVVPKNLNDDKGHKLIREKIQSYTKGLFGKATYLLIGFDDSASDFLSGIKEQ